MSDGWDWKSWRARLCTAYCKLGCHTFKKIHLFGGVLSKSKVGKVYVPILWNCDTSGNSGYLTVFKISPDGSQWQLSISNGLNGLKVLFVATVDNAMASENKWWNETLSVHLLNVVWSLQFNVCVSPWCKPPLLLKNYKCFVTRDLPKRPPSLVEQCRTTQVCWEPWYILITLIEILKLREN